MTTMTFHSFAAPSRPPRQIRCAPCTTRQAPPLASTSVGAHAPRGKISPLALAGTIACLHLVLVVTLSRTGRTVSAPLKPVAVAIALAAPRVEPPPLPPPPREKTPPQRVRLAAAPARALAAPAPAQAMPLADSQAPLPAAPDSLPIAAAPPAPAVAAVEKITEPRGYAGYLRNPAPDYPPAAQRRGLEGQVMLKVHVLASGQPDRVTVEKSSGHAILDDAAIKAVVQWAFAPARRGQSPIDGWVQVPLTFKI